LRRRDLGVVTLGKASPKSFRDRAASTASITLGAGVGATAPEASPVEGEIVAQARDGRGGELCAEPVGRVNVFCSDGAVAIDNNVSEREMKRVVLKRCKQGKRRTTLCGSIQLLARPSAGCRPNSVRAEGVSVFFQSRPSANPSRRTPHGEEPCSLPGSVDSGASKHPQ
jgi:hypothetical protein